MCSEMYVITKNDPKINVRKTRIILLPGTHQDQLSIPDAVKTRLCSAPLGLRIVTATILP